MMTKKDEKGGRLTPYVTPAGAWALSLGTAIGWGSLVVTSNTYLSQAGPAGSIAGILRGQDFERREELIRQLNEMSETNIHRDREPVVSAGMEVFNPEKDEALRAVFERADAAMYRRKQQLKGMGAKVRE